MNLDRIAFAILIVSVAFTFGCEDTREHEHFMNEGECIVLRNEVKQEPLGYYTVESIDASKASGCALTLLKDKYLLNLNADYYVSVSPKHPKKNLRLIEYFRHRYYTDTTRLSGFQRKNNTVALDLDKQYVMRSDKEHHLKYYKWKYVYLTFQKGEWVEDSASLVNFWPWGEQRIE